MKNWLSWLLFFCLGMIATAVLFLVASPPRGNSVELLPAPTAGPILVYVDGAVLKPGVYTLPQESRVQAAIQAAGGLSAQANAGALNLAAHLKDGDKLLVPAQGTPLATPSTAEKPSSSGNKTNPVATLSAPININTASLDELQALPGIGPTRAQQIVDYRQSHGGFQAIDEIMNVSGIGPATFEKLKPFITVN